MNLRVLKPSRKPLRQGDVFTMQIPDGRFLFGQVMLADIPPAQAPMPRSNLIYVYRATADTPEPDHGALRPDNLLLPPIFTNRLAWSKGYFNTVAHRELSDADLLSRHCFRRATTRSYVDLTGKPIDGPIEPCGEWGLAGYLLIDREISDALGIPRAPVSG
jgi:hypothetical protein